MSVVAASLMALTAAPPVCDIRDHGAASGDGVHDTAAIQAAVDACAGTGGTVLIPAGAWSTGMVRLGSRMVLELAEGAVLALHADIALFPEVSTGSAEPIDTVRSALLADGVTGLRITGKGRIEGNGEAFWDADFYASGRARPTLPRPGPAIELSDCRDTHVAGITLTNMPAYALRFHRCDGVSVRGVTIRNDPRSPNTDGIQIRDTSNAVISGVDIRTGDDAIVLKSGARAVDNVLVEDSYLESDDAALKFGTGSRVGVTNSVFRNLTIAQSRYGIALFMIDGGTHRGNRFEDIRITTGGRHPRQFPIFIDIDRRSADRTLGRVVDTTFRRIAITTSGASLIAGNPAAPIEGLLLQDISMKVRDAVDLAARSAKPRGNVEITAQAGSTDYSTRAAHLVLAHVRGLEMEGVTVTEAAPSDRREHVLRIDVEPAANEGANDGSS